MIQPIPTLYRGVSFRSRLEARWAVFYDALGIEWQYEPEGYSLPHGPYLPDFWLPQIAAFIEIKPPGLGHREGCFVLCADLAEATGKSVVCFSREVGPPDGSDLGAAWFGPTAEETSPMFEWCQCEGCGRLSIEYMGLGNGARCRCPKGNAQTSRSAALLAAYNAAWTARFWR